MATGNDVHALIQSLSYEDLITLLECIDFEGIFNSEFVKQFVDLSGYTNEQIIDAVNRYEKYCTLALKYAIRLTNAVANRIPDKYMDNSFLDLIEYEDENDKFSYEDGTFSYVGTHTLTYDHLETAVARISNLLGVNKDTAMMVLAILPDSFIEHGFTATLDFSIHFEKINRIDYMANGKVIKSGFLPAGAKVAYFAEATNPNLLCWVDEDLNVVTTMPDHDIVIHAVYNDGKAYLTKPVENKQYDGTSETVGIFIGDNQNTYTYRWYKNGQLVHETATFEVSNVSDSGVYTYEVWSNGQRTHTGQIGVTILPIVIPADNVTIETDFFEYDGTAHSVKLVGLPEGVSAIPSGTVTATAWGDYTVTFTLVADNANYAADPAIVEFNWSIKKCIDVSDLEWHWPRDKHDEDNITVPVYNGTEFEAYLTGEHLDKLELVLDGNVATNAGKYTAKIVSVSVKEEYRGEYKVVGDLDANVLNWRIDPKSIHVTDVEWMGGTRFEYDGNEHSVCLDPTTIPEGVVPHYTDNAATDVLPDGAIYVASVTFTLAEGYENNYKIIGEAPTHQWRITPKRISHSGNTIHGVVGGSSTFTWTTDDTLVYDGTLQSIYITGLSPAFGVSYLDGSNTGMSAGGYTAHAIIYLNTNNYIWDNPIEVKHDWSIEKAKIVVTDIVWNYVVDTLVYNGQAHTVKAEWTLADESYADYVLVDYTGNTATDVSAEGYKATISFRSFSDNYRVVTAEGVSEKKELSWNITPATIDVSGLDWNVSGILPYTGSVQGVVLNTEGLPAEINIVYGTGTSQTNAGTYTATAEAFSDSLNYVVSGTIEDCTWTIPKAQIDGSSITFGGETGKVTVTYNGKAHSITVKGDNSVLAMLNVKYEGNAKILLGTYTVTATITVKDAYASNYEYYDQLTATLLITGDKKTSHQLKEGSEVIVEVQGSLDPDNLIAGGTTTKVESTFEVNGRDAELLAAYDIYFTEGGSVVSVNGQTFTVKLLIPAKYRALEDDELAVIHIKDDGSIEVMEATREGNYMVFTTDHFSVYAVVRVEGVNLAWLLIVLAALLAAGIVVGMIFYRKSKNDETTPDEIPAVEAAPVSEVPAEQPEEVVEEELVEEEEEITEVDEVVEEETETEIPEIDEVVTEEEAAEVELEDEPAIEEPKTAVLVMGEDGKEATAIIGGEVVHIRFRSSFMSRLIQSTENIQGFYSDIKNHVLSYKGIKARGSWNYEAFNKGRNQLVKLNIKGKTLIVNLNLDPKEFNINKYHFIDCSDKPKFAKVPMMMKVRSARALKYTLELIDEMMAKYEITQGDVPTVDYRMPYETTEELAKRGLVKVILPAGVTLSDDMTLVHVNVSELIGSGTNEKTTEQLIAEDLVIEEAPIVEAAPEKFEPVVEELEDGTWHADAEVADQLITDEEAEAKIEVVSVEATKRTGKMGEINLDTICDNFDDGETVDVDALKAKHLVSSKIGRVKVLARGIMYKKLTVKASKFSIQAVKMITLAGGKVELEE